MQLTPDQHDALTEVFNIGVGRAAASLSSLLGKSIALSVPRLRMCHVHEFASESDQTAISVIQSVHGAIEGRAVLSFPETSGITLARLLGATADVQLDAGELDLDLSCILEEVGNIVLNAVMGTLANCAGGTVSFSIPRVASKCAITDLLLSTRREAEADCDVIIVADTEFDVTDSQIRGQLVLAAEVLSLEQVVPQLPLGLSHC
ncbi:MAG: chemotaxis protein CheC [Planctomycetales bacterium]|nr:chemotaxis protein CheC [Planctomycetales bacterium]